MAVTSARFREIVLEEARNEGFPLAETIDLAAALDVDQDSAFAPHLQRFDSWLAQGRQGEMGYLARGRDRRADPRKLMPEAKAMLCVALPYPRRPAGASSLAQGPRYARYLQGPDYHADISERLARAMERTRARIVEESGLSVPRPNSRIPAPKLGGPGDSVMRWKVCVDTSAVLERSWAALAGLGWIGKNTLLIHPKEGSYLFLGEVLLDRETGRGPAPIPDYCGHCTRCLDACPTKALLAARELDSRKCISYATLEKRGDWPSEVATTAGYVAGCDICQEACPFNQKPVAKELATETYSPTQVPSPADPTLQSDPTRLADWSSLRNESEEAYRNRVQGTALERIKPADFRRNIEKAARDSEALMESHPVNANWSAMGVVKP